MVEIKNQVNSATPDNIQVLWDGFITSESKSFEKLVWFDTFLAEFLAQVKEGKSVKDILASSVTNSGSVSTLVSCELLSDVHNLCNVPGEGEELAALREHLLTGRGWRCLAVLHCLGLQEVSCSRELASLLISLYTVGGEDEGEGEAESHNPYLPLRGGVGEEGEAICRPQPLRRKSRSFSHSEATPPRKNSFRVPRAVTAPELGKEEESSESEDPESSEAHQIRSALKIRLNPMDFDYFTSVVRSDDEAPVENVSFNPVRSRKVSSKQAPEDFCDDRIKDVMKQKINSFEFKMLLVDLLSGLVKSENVSQQINSNQQSVCLQTLNFSLETLCSLQFGADEVTKRGSQLKCTLSRLLLSSLEKVLIHPEMTLSALQKGVLPVMLRLSEDILRKHPADVVKEIKDVEEALMTNVYIFNVIYGVITAVHCLLIQNSSADKLDQFLTLFHQFGNSLNGRLIDKTVSVLLSFTEINQRKCTDRAKKIILLVGQLITALKKTRTKIVHARQCRRSRHKPCLSKALMHHHDNIFGCVYVGSILTPSTQQNCSIASLFMTLTKFLSDSMDRDIVIRTLQLMTSCGTCCCFPALVLLKKIAKLLTCTDQRIRSSGLVLLERTFYRQLGAFEENTNCELCAKDSRLEYFDESSKCSSSDVSSNTGSPVAEGKQPKWGCLALFKDLLLSSDSKLAFLIGTHLLRIIPQCKLAFKQEILFTVFYPVFLKARERFSENQSEIDKFLVITCLSVFTNLLRRVRIVEQFIDLKATSHIMEMLQDKDAMNLCCSILEIVVITQIWKLDQKKTEDNDAQESFRKSSVNVTEFDFLLEEIRWSSTKCLSMHVDNLEKAVAEDDNITIRDDTLVFSSTHCYQQYTQLLVSLTSLWKTLANLSLYSPQVRQYIHERTTTVLAHSLLVIVLKRITKSTSIQDEPLRDKEGCVSQLHLKLAESLLVLCLVCPPAEDNPETFMSCKALVRQLKPLLTSAVASGSVTIRQVCDVLYRASLAQPSSRLVLPTHKMPKVGSLAWEGGDTVMSLVSSTSCVQFEETVSDYDSSPELTADEGYEADVEIRDHLSEQAEEDISAGLVSLSASRKVSMDHRRTAQITHPELCMLAVDLVSSFVQSESLGQSQLVDCSYCLQRLARENCHLLVQHRMVSRLMTQFSDVLSSSDTKYSELQCAVLELVSVLARQSVEPHELTQYIRFFTVDDPPLESLLPPLMSIVANSQVQPSYAFKFPVECEDRVYVHSQSSPAEKTAVAMRQQHVAAGIYSSWSCSALALPINTDLGWSMWVNGFSLAFWLRLHPSPSPPTPPTEPPADHADVMCSDTSLSETWNTENGTLLQSSDGSQKLAPPPQPLPPSLMHLVSVGFDVMVLEVWVEVASGKLVFRLVRPDGKRQELLCEASVLGKLSADQWHNLAINVRDSVQKRKVVIEVLLLVDGYVAVQVPLVFTGLLIRKARPSCLLLGHCGSAGSYFMISSVLMFRAPVFNKENATNLVAHGPDYIHLTQADVGNIKPNLATVFRVEAIQSGVNWESVYHNQASTLRELQENLLISYSAENHTTMNAYPQAISNATDIDPSLNHILQCSQQFTLVFQQIFWYFPHQYHATEACIMLLVTNFGSHVTISDKIPTVVPLAPRRYHDIKRHGTIKPTDDQGVVGSLFPPTPGFRVATVDTRTSQLLPMSVRPIFFAPAAIQHYHGITIAADTIGGISVFLFLFARVVELKGSDESQAQALYILLKLAQSSCELNSQFESRDVARLLCHVLSSPRCSPSQIMIKMIFDVCCDRPGLMTVHPATGQVSVSSSSPCIVVEPLLLAGPVVLAWRQWARVPGALSTLLQALQALLRDDHPHREFNAAQFNNARLVESLLHFCKEVFLSGEPPLSLDPHICPAIVELIRSLMGAPPDMPHIVAIFDYLVLAHPASATYITTVRPSFYFLVNTAASNHSSSNQSEVDSNIGSIRKSKSMLSNINEADIPQLTDLTKHHRMTQPVDPTKLNKALANLQIKQLGQQQTQTVSLNTSLDTNRSDAFTSSGQGSMDEFSSDDKLTSSLSETLPPDSTSPAALPPATTVPPTTTTATAGLDEDKEQAETRQDEVPRLGQLKQDPAKRPESANSGAGEAGVTEGLLLLLRDVTLVLPDSMVHQVLSHVIKMEALLVMANHHLPVVRTAVVKVLSAYIQRASEEELARFVRSKGYYQLANQLGLWPATVELVEGVVAMVTGLHWLPLEEQLEDEEGTLNSLQLAALPPLLALLPNCVHNLPLAHNLIHFLQRLFTKVAQGQRALMDCGLVETLCKTLIVISHSPSQPTDLSDVSDRDILVTDVQSLLLTVVSNAIHSPGNHNMQVVTDILVILRYLERLEGGFCGPKAVCVATLRTTQCAVLSHAEQLIQDKITSQQLPAGRIRSMGSAFLSSVLSPGLEDATERPSPGPLGASKSSSNSDSVNSLGSSLGSGWGSLGRPNKVPRSEINDRFKMIITKAVEFFIYSERNTPMSAVEENFARHLLSVLLSGMAAIVDRRSGSRNTWSTIVWNCRDTVRAMTGQLMMWMLSPGQPNRLRMFVIQSLRNQLKAKDVIASIVLINSQIEQQFVLYLWELMYGVDSSSLLSAEILFCEELKELLQTWGIYSPAAIGHDYDPWTDDLANMARAVYNQRCLWTKQQEAIVNRTISRLEGVVRAVTEAAMAVTRTVVEAQNCERKAMMERLKHSLSDSVHAQLQWKLLAHQLTHERAVWHFPQCYPRSWQLDETEGPARVRKRLKRCHLTIEKRFLKPEFQDKLDAATRPQPLSYLFGSEGPSMSSVLIERLHTDEKIRHMASARIVTPAHEHPGELLIGETCLYFVPSTEPSKLDVTNGSLDACSQAWQFEDVKEIHNRRYQLQERALEIFLLNGKTYLLAFETSTERDLFASELSQCELPHRVASDHLADTVQLWREGHLTNWEYLTTLNKMAGRSYNDLMQYPVMPFILADYTSATLDLTDPKSYRNFQKPMAVQEKSSEQHYINNYNYLKQELTDALNLISINQEAYHYSSHYSNSGTVLHFLVRLPPFTSMFINYQDNNFDLPDRTFHSVHTTWRLTSSESPTDVKELIPEFFFLPEFLANHEGFDFGTRQNGSKVDQVDLPPWACGDPRRFILVHRQALESDYVRENLPHWIDLVFGYKQTGKAAVDSINVFHPATYYGFNPESIPDPLERTAWETMVKTYGQTPRQLFRAAHPMVVQALVPKTTTVSTVPGVKGLSWGNYVGSPSDSAPSVIWQQQHRTPVASLIPLLTNDVFGLAPSTALLLAYSKEKTLSLVASGGTCVLGAALVSWGHSDGILRAKLRKEQPPYPAIRPPRCGGPVTQCVSVPDCNQLWLGYASGKILVYRYKFKPSKGTLEFGPEPAELLGHSAAVLSLTLCRAYSVALSGAADGSAILWDINRLSYVRSLPNISLPVSLTCVSEVSGDLVTVGSDTDSGGSTVRLHTVNVALVGSVTTRQQITAVCFSTAPEGVAVNVIATGMSDGVIRLWSTWDLSAVGEIVVNSIDHPVIGLTYSHDSQHLYASTDNGSVIIWEGSAAKGGSKTPKFLNLTTLI